MLHMDCYRKQQKNKEFVENILDEMLNLIIILSFKIDLSN
jgi:hypothetical protein